MQGDALREEYTIDTPENVTVGYEVAGIGSRFIGALVDTSLIVIALVVLNIGIALLLGFLGRGGSDLPADSEDPGWVVGLLIAIYALVNFALVWGYYIGFELRWNGQSPGKRVAGTQVVRQGGAPAGFGESAIRNVVRLVDFLPFAYGVGLVTMIFNRQARRLGDFAAGTLVIKVRSRVSLDDLGAAPKPGGADQAASEQGEELPGGLSDELAARYPRLRDLRGSDYQLISDLLARPVTDEYGWQRLRRAGIAIAQRVGAAPPYDSRAAQQLLVEVAAAYRALGRGPA